MTETLVLLAFLVITATSIWLVAKKAGRDQEKLKDAKQKKDDEQNQNLLVSAYINMSSQQLLDSVRKKRQTAEERMRTKDRLD